MAAERSPVRDAARPRAFGWTLAQPVAIGICALLGAFSGWMFSRDNLAFAWILFLFGFIWVLIMSLLLGMRLAYQSRLARGEWRAALHIGFASAFPLATAYLALVALLTLPIELRSVPLAQGGQALSRPDLLLHAPVLYLCSLLVGTISGPLYALASPLRRETAARAVAEVEVEDALPVVPE